MERVQSRPERPEGVAHEQDLLADVRLSPERAAGVVGGRVAAERRQK